MFLNKIDVRTLLPCCILCCLPASEAVLKPVFGELALFWCSTVKSNGTPKIVIAKNSLLNAGMSI